MLKCHPNVYNFMSPLNQIKCYCSTNYCRQHYLYFFLFFVWHSLKFWYPVLVNYCNVIMSAMASQITGVTIVYSTVHSGADQRKHQSSVSLAFVRGIRQWQEHSPHKGPVPRKLSPFDDVIDVDLFEIGFLSCNLNQDRLFHRECQLVWFQPFHCGVFITLNNST